MMPMAALPGVPAFCLRRGHGQHRRAEHNRRRAADHLGPVLRPRAAQFLEQQAAPEQPHQAIRVPQRKRNRQPHVAHGENGQRVGHRPQHSAQQRPHHQVRLLAQVVEHESRALQHRGNRPARHKRAHHHAHRNQERGESLVHQLRRRFRAAQPHRRRKPAEHAQLVQGNSRPRCAAVAVSRSSVHLSIISSVIPRISTTTGTQRCTSVRMANQLRSLHAETSASFTGRCSSNDFFAASAITTGTRPSAPVTGVGLSSITA